MTTELYNLLNSVRSVLAEKGIKLLAYSGNVRVVSSNNVGGNSNSMEVYHGDYCLLTKEYYDKLLENQVGTNAPLA